MMGCIVATTFGFVLKDKSLLLLSLANVIIGIILSTSFGFVFGFIIGCIDDRFISGDDGVTKEMLSCCELRSLIIGVLIALISGTAAGIATLGSKTESLVGAAISISILPPAVNAVCFLANV